MFGSFLPITLLRKKERKMTNAISDVTKLVPTTANGTTQSQSQKPASPQSQSKANIPQDTVNISSAAKAAQAEAVETPVQTAKEARSGDLQAQRLLAKAAAQRLQK